MEKQGTINLSEILHKLLVLLLESITNLVILMRAIKLSLFLVTFQGTMLHCI